MKADRGRYYFYGVIFLFSIIILGGATKDILKVYTDYKEERLEMDTIFPYGDQTQCQYKSRIINIEGKCSQVFYILKTQNIDELYAFVAVDYGFEREKEITHLVNVGTNSINKIITTLSQEVNNTFSSLNSTQKDALYSEIMGVKQFK